MGVEGVVRIVQVGNVFGFSFGVQSKHSLTPCSPVITRHAARCYGEDDAGLAEVASRAALHERNPRALTHVVDVSASL